MVLRKEVPFEGEQKLILIFYWFIRKKSKDL